MAIFDPGTLLQLALFKEMGPRTSRRTSLVGRLRLRRSSLAYAAASAPLRMSGSLTTSSSGTPARLQSTSE